MKIILTGAEGFVGRYISTELKKYKHEVIKCSFFEHSGFIQLDITNQTQVEELIKEQKPDAFINMAGQADVGLSWKIPQKTFQINTIGAINIMEAVKKTDRNIRIVLAGSSDEYGFLGSLGSDVTEDFELRPLTPYAISKVAQEKMADIYYKNYGLNVCVARCFTLSGPGQAKGFVITDFASGIADIEKGKKDFLSVGNLGSARDFTHVKDAARAYCLIVEKGKKGEVYNISSGKTYTLQEVLDRLIVLSNKEIIVKQDPSKMRPSDTPVICGNNSKLKKHTGWHPEIGIDTILSDTLNYWREQN